MIKIEKEGDLKRIVMHDGLDIVDRDLDKKTCVARCDRCGMLVSGTIDDEGRYNVDVASRKAWFRVGKEYYRAPAGEYEVFVNCVAADGSVWKSVPINVRVNRYTNPYHLDFDKIAYTTDILLKHNSMCDKCFDEIVDMAIEKGE
jgi:hypothetical protein